MLRAEVLDIMLYGCITWNPRACHYDTPRRAHHSFLTPASVGERTISPGYFVSSAQIYEDGRRLQPRTRGNGAERQNKGRNISWRNGSLQRKPRLDYGMQWYIRT
ncbi:unnamed protein product [Ascophyllum nodosum]